MKVRFFDGKSSRVVFSDVRIVHGGVYLVDLDILWKFEDIRIVQKPEGEFCGVITNYQNPDQRLEIKDNNLFAEIKNNISVSRVNFIYFREFVRDHFKMLLMVVIAILALPFSLQFLNNQLDDDFMDKIGGDILEIFVTEENKCKNPQGLEELQKLVNQISSSNDEFKVFVINKKSVNAVALPGGNIVIFSGLLDKFKSPNELAFILGHEIGHLEHEHHKFQFIVSSLLSNINSKLVLLMQLKRSRGGEIEADEFGYNLMLANNIDPKYGVDAFTRLKSDDDLDQGFEKLLSYVSTHPATGDRIEIIKEKSSRISDSKRSQFGQIISDQSWGMIKGICKK